MLATPVLSVFSIATAAGNLLAAENTMDFDEATRRGMVIALMGMAIVMIALTFISLFIASMPRILGSVAKVYPEREDPHARRAHAEKVADDDEAVLAAIGFVLHTEFQKQLANKNGNQG